MPKLSLKLLFGVGGTSLACALPVGVFFGLKSNDFSSKEVVSATQLPTNEQSSSSHLTSLSSRSIASCSEGGEEIGIEIPENSGVSSEEIELLKKQMKVSGSCNSLDGEEEREDGEMSDDEEEDEEEDDDSLQQ